MKLATRKNLKPEELLPGGSMYDIAIIGGGPAGATLYGVKKVF
jgi:alkyl hydroperoxide reductase subunit AhpF